MEFDIYKIQEWMNELGITKDQAREMLEKEFGWFDKETLDYKELQVMRELEKDIDVEKNKKLLAAIRILCAPSKCPLDRKVIKDSSPKHVIDVEALFGTKY